MAESAIALLLFLEPLHFASEALTVLPTIAYRVPGVAAFADATFDRLRNPYQQHKLADIALNHADKIRVRLQPTHDEYVQLFQRSPVRLAEVLAAKV